MNKIIQHFQAWIAHETALINNPNPLLVLAVILVVGYICSRLARKLHIPVVTAQIAGVVILGKYVLNLFRADAFAVFVYNMAIPCFEY